ncbi:hypothetical protein EJ04DRAFT_560415 [Polyplosphaeria fusca]|uniref:Uncharacterized protein n=1 Tax=Polyplosphaeria fusca TaxID=682080 RepID=A0A9P4R975_9PLEO|nr:hypothetical protein EJ04DRAFT_560415 [Polyplosphaeria fusca]
MTLIVLLSSVSPSLQDNTCSTVREFNDYNATRSYPMPALSVGRVPEFEQLRKLDADDSEQWYLTSRFTKIGSSGNEGLTHVWVNTGDSNTTNIGSCVDITWTHSLGKFTFSKEVIERSVDDNGDCKTMLGEECVNALNEHYTRIAASAMYDGECPRGSDWNTTVPAACASLVGDNLKWNGGLFGSGSNLSSVYDNRTLANSSCDDVEPLNSTMHGAGGYGGSYNESIRFPAPVFWYFWPNNTSPGNSFPSSVNDFVHVEIKCMRPDEINEGSEVPPDAEALYNADGVEFASSGNDSSDGGNGGNGGNGGDDDNAASGIAGDARVYAVGSVFGTALFAALMMI